MKTPFTVEETEKICDLISCIINGPEQGVITNQGVEEKEIELVGLLRSRGYEPHGQKVSYLERKKTL